MKRHSVVALAFLVACDVEVSLGSHDAGDDAPLACSSPADAGACVACRAALCCDAFSACAVAPTCPCIVECVLARATVDDCVAHCGGPDHGEHVVSIECAQAMCSTSCP